MPNDETYRITAEGLKDLMKIGARETARILEERDSLLKFAMAVEILPKLERAGIVKFPLDYSMHKKASKLAQKSFDEIQKLAFVAKHAAVEAIPAERALEGDVKVASSTVGRLTTELMAMSRD